MSDDKKPLDPNRPLLLGELLLINGFHQKYIDELSAYRVDNTAQLEQQQILNEVLQRFFNLTFAQLLRIDVNNPDMYFEITAGKTNEEKFLKELREKYFGPKAVDGKVIH